MKATLREYFSALGKWIWVMVADIIGIAQDLLLDIPLLKQFRIEFWLILLFTFLVIANIHAFHKLRIQRGELRSTLDDRIRTREILKKLADMRTKGVALRNEGLQLRDEATAEKWISKAKKWETSIKKQIQDLSSAQAEVFNTLDWVKQRPFSTNIPKTAFQRLNMLCDQIENLKTLIEKSDATLVGNITLSTKLL